MNGGPMMARHRAPATQICQGVLRVEGIFVHEVAVIVQHGGEQVEHLDHAHLGNLRRRRAQEQPAPLEMPKKSR